MHFETLRRLSEQLALTIAGMRQRACNRRAFEQLDVTETERLLRDIGLSMSDMPALTKPNAGPTVLLPQRLNMLRLDSRYLQEADPVTMKDLQRACLRCASWRRCARDLARGDAQSGLSSYCINASTIDLLLLARHGEPD